MKDIYNYSDQDGDIDNLQLNMTCSCMYTMYKELQQNLSNQDTQSDITTSGHFLEKVASVKKFLYLN